MKQKIDLFDYAGHILKSLSRGVLLTTQAEGRVNSMTIGWGFMGIDWYLPIFVTLVRRHRFSYSLLQKNPEFTVNIPVGNFDKRILAICGSKSGKDFDKNSYLGLHMTESEKISVPGIAELPLTLECRVIYKKEQDAAEIPESIMQKWHPQHIGPEAPGANRDLHTCFYGEIVNAYIIEY